MKRSENLEVLGEMGDRPAELSPQNHGVVGGLLDNAPLTFVPFLAKTNRPALVVSGGKRLTSDYMSRHSHGIIASLGDIASYTIVLENIGERDIKDAGDFGFDHVV